MDSMQRPAAGFELLASFLVREAWLPDEYEIAEEDWLQGTERRRICASPSGPTVLPPEQR